ncbi:hypothetical protein U8V72_20805 [Priestia filamentosa]|uniref:hypothetical protein n=1 Tax=Priestia filamentosa TaxID=1402861 RepID=UPI003978E950
MEKETFVKKLNVVQKVEKTMEETQNILYKKYRSNKNKDMLPENIWGENNRIELKTLPSFINELKYQYNVLDINTDLVVHYTVDGSSDGYENFLPRVILFDFLKPIYAEAFDHFIEAPGEGEYNYCGLLKEGFKELLEAIFVYDEFKVTSIKENE